MTQKEFAEYQKEIKNKKYHNILVAMVKMKNLDIVKGIDNNKIALVSIEKRGTKFLVGVEEEIQDNFGYFEKRHQEYVTSIDDAIDFFDSNGIGEITWLKSEKIAA